ncbi:flagellar hook-length control protein FliK [Georgenia yuyongxinii]|uniref:Flagellar hook-length control protein FliK n=1 Tax=Georgenia yuyongxinii TaxID=2589797 RepID=A0A5B8C368_9MICO|nr:flagellar hook-length control protein FliK [Georgenia yuyongxinii]QDC23642.1 flagellar hook-length control protein FliK [Georgenia yuyongxinii]
MQAATLATGSEAQPAPAASDAQAITAASSASATAAASPQVLVASTAPAPPTAQAAPVATPAPVPLTEQLAGPLARLRALPDGTHVLTVHIEPESLGPLRVTAHITGEGVRIELLGATDAAREALRVTLTDLRRELAATGLSADLQLGQERGDGRHAGQAAQAGAGNPDGSGRPASTDRPTGDRGRPSQAPPSSIPPGPTGPIRPGTLDLYA